MSSFYLNQISPLLVVRGYSRKAKSQWRNTGEPGHLNYQRVNAVTKHQQLAERSASGPSRFYFVTPFDMLATSDLPEWAGLISVRMETTWRQMKVLTVKKAPLLHKQKIDPKIEQHARGVCYYRMHNLFRKI